MKKLFNNRIFMGAGAIVIALIISFVSAPVAELFTSSNTQVVRAKEFIEQGTKITSDMIEKAAVGKFNLQTDVIVNEQDVVNQYAAVDISPKDNICKSKVSAASGEFEYLSNLADGKLAMSIELTGSAMSVSGKLRANDIVSIFSDAADMSYEADELSIDETLKLNAAASYGLAYLELQYVRVLAVVDSIDIDIAMYAQTTSTVDGNKAANTISTIVLEVNAKQAQLLAGINDKGLHFALISRGNKEKETSMLKMQDEMFAQP